MSGYEDYLHQLEEKAAAEAQLVGAVQKAKAILREVEVQVSNLSLTSEEVQMLLELRFKESELAHMVMVSAGSKRPEAHHAILGRQPGDHEVWAFSQGSAVHIQYHHEAYRQ